MRLVPRNASICDAGCGENPVLLKALAGSASKRVGIDILVKDGNTSGIELRRGDLTKRLPIKDGEFDTITLLAVMEHLEDPEQLLKECWRGLKRGGCIILTTPAPSAKTILELLAGAGMISRKEIHDHKHYFNSKELVELLTGAKFKAIKAWNVSLGLNNVAIGFKR